MKRTALAKAAALGLLTAVVGVLGGMLPPVAQLETSVGLDWLFRMRGPRTPPPAVVVVTVDHQSCERLGLPEDLDQWPRSFHARLVRTLTRLGARVIAFDVIFSEARDPVNDRDFAAAVRAANNVVLFETLKRENRPLHDSRGQSIGDVSIERRVPPIPQLAEAARGIAPFPLPKVPVKVSQFWLFKGGAGDVPTLPVVAFQVFAGSAQQTLLSEIQYAAPEGAYSLNGATAGGADQAQYIRSLRQLFRDRPALIKAIEARLHEDNRREKHPENFLMRRLLAMYGETDSRYLDFYGPPHTITTVPYYRILEGPLPADPQGAPLDLRGKAVFVGMSAEHQPDQKDGFYTVFSRADGLDVSGVEIAATAFANLLEGRHVTPLPGPYHYLLIALWGLALGALLYWLPGPFLLPAAAALAALCLGLPYYLFARDGLWLPVVIPLLVQMPVALIGATLWRYLEARHGRQQLREAFTRYLPPEVVDEVSVDTVGTAAQGRLLHGVCLASDAEHFTGLSETLEPGELRAVLNDYYATLFEPVRRHGGLVSDVVGDAMLALWSSPQEQTELKQHACRAALEIIDATAGLRQRGPISHLRTRIGLHCGAILLGNVGAGDHFEYRAVGEIVNTATRLEGLNKVLGTQVLASAQLVREVEGIGVREVGNFCLAGKSAPLVVYEVRCGRIGEQRGKDDDGALFAAGLAAFREQRWQDAAGIFRELLTYDPADGPARYYLRLCTQYQQNPPPADWCAVVSISQK